MNLNKNIRSLDDLQREIRRLKTDYKKQEADLTRDTHIFLNQFSLGGMLKKYASPNGFLKLDEKINLSSRVMTYLLPFLLNKTIFRGSGFLTKAIATLVSGKVGKSLDAETLSGAVNFVKSLFGGSGQNRKKNKRKEELTFADYGIPPDSETF